MQSECTEMAFKERIFRIIEFPTRLYWSSGKIALKSAKSFLGC